MTRPYTGISFCLLFCLLSTLRATAVDEAWAALLRVSAGSASERVAAGAAWREQHGIRPGPWLYTCRRDGTGMRKVSANIDIDHTPHVMANGRVMFARWDYGIEKNVFARHALWTMNPDGTAFQLFFGNTIEDPGGLWKARPIPGRPEVVCVFGPHHTFQAGMAGLVWNLAGPIRASRELRNSCLAIVTACYPQ